jgi:hypothetical protein
VHTLSLKNFNEDRRHDAAGPLKVRNPREESVEDVNFREKLTMAVLRLLLILFNVLIIAFLIYRMVDVIRRPVEKSRKAMILIGGTLLLLAPLGIFFRFFAATPQYFLIYPVAIFMFLYLTKQLSIR